MLDVRACTVLRPYYARNDVALPTPLVGGLWRHQASIDKIEFTLTFCVRWLAWAARSVRIKCVLCTPFSLPPPPI